MRILGLDPGLATTGFAILDAPHPRKLHLVTCGCILTHKDTPFSRRLVEIQDDLVGLIEKYRPEVAAVETLLFNKNVRTAIAVGQTRGVLLVTLERLGVALVEYNPTSIKKAVVGYGKGDKKQVQFMVTRLLHLDAPPHPDDAADAVAVALCHRFAVRPGVPSPPKTRQ